MVTDALAGEWIELPAPVVAGMAAELPPARSGSALEALRPAPDVTAAHCEAALAADGLVEDGELVPWLARAMSVLLWPEALIRTCDTVASAPATRFVAADTLVRYGHADGVCLIGRPTGRDAFVDDLVALCTSTVERAGDPPVLELTRWTLQAIDTVLASDRTDAGARAALALLTSDPDGPDGIIAAMLEDELLADAGDALVPGRAIDGWSDALDSRRRLDIQRLELADGADPAAVRTMAFIGPPGDRCLIVPVGGDDLLLVRPTVEEARSLVDAFLTPVPPAEQPDGFAPVAAAWRASADALIAGGRP